MRRWIEPIRRRVRWRSPSGAVAFFLLLVCAVWLSVRFASFSVDDPLYDAPLRVGAWNLQWFGKGHMRPEPCDRLRTESDIRKIAEYIDEIGYHALILEEISGEPALRNLVASLRRVSGYRWKYYLGIGGYSLRLALIWNDQRVEVESLSTISMPAFLSWRVVEDLPEPFEALRVFSRRPLWALLRDRRTGIDFRLIGVHIKSQVNNPEAPPSTLVQREEIRLLSEWLSEYLSDPGNEEDVILVGDFNFGPANPLFRGIERSVPLVSALPVEPLPTWRDDWTIDHIFVSMGARSEWGGRPLEVHNRRFLVDPDEFLCSYSDHMPTSITLAGVADDD